MIEMSTNTKWIQEMAEKEDNRPVSVGGLQVTLAALEHQETSPELAAVGILLDLRRRKLSLSVSDLARRAHVAEGELASLGRGLKMPNSRDVIVLLAQALGLPAEKLLAAAGLGGTADPDLRLAAIRCADQARAPVPLSPTEDAALGDFLGALAVK